MFQTLFFIVKHETMVGLVAQLVERSLLISEIYGSNSVIVNVIYCQLQWKDQNIEKGIAEFNNCIVKASYKINIFGWKQSVH